MPNQDLNAINIDNLPIDILLEIFSHLSLDHISKAASVNKKFNLAINNNLFWQEIFKHYFPHILSRMKIKSNLNWYDEVRKVYDSKLEGLKNENLPFNKLDEHKSNRRSLIKRANEKGSQELLNHFYQIAIKEYTDSISGQLDTNKTDSAGRTILHWAILCHQSVNTINALIKQGANIEATRTNGATPLFIAAKNGHLDILKTLLAKGADINTARYGITPLFIAAKNGHLDILNVLLEKGANVEATRANGITSLLVAAQNGHLDIVKALLENGANIDAHTIDTHINDGITPLFIAAKNGYLDIVKALLENGANTNLACKNGATPLSIAKEYQNKEIVLAIKLHNYTNKINNRITNGENYTPYTIFGHKFDLHRLGVCSAQEKKAAVNALKSVFFGNADKSILDDHQKALSDGKLSKLKSKIDKMSFQKALSDGKLSKLKSKIDKMSFQKALSDGKLSKLKSKIDKMSLRK